MTDSDKIAQAAMSGASLAGYNGTPDYQHVYYEANGQPYWKKVGGGKQYIPPATAMSMTNDPKALSWARSQGYYIDGGQTGSSQQPTVDASGNVQQAPSPVHGTPPSGGLLHNSGTWNSQTGQWDQGLDWGNILSMVVAGTITAGVASAMMGGGAAADAAANTAASTGSVDAGIQAGATASSAGAGTGAAASAEAGAVLPGASGVPALGTLPAVGSSGGVGAALGGDAGAVGAGGYAAQQGLTDTGEATTTGATPLSGSDVGNIDTLAGAANGTSGASSTIADLLKKIAPALGAVGQGVGAATQSAGQTQYLNNLLGVQANNSNISGQSAFEKEMMDRAAEEDKQRIQAQKDAYRLNLAQNPRVSPFDPVGAQPLSPDYLAALTASGQQGQATMSAPAQYRTSNQPPLTPYTPYKPNTDLSTLQTIGNWASPTLSTISALASLFSR